MQDRQRITKNFKNKIPFSNSLQGGDGEVLGKLLLVQKITTLQSDHFNDPIPTDLLILLSVCDISNGYSPNS
jgi:hypothetical protein